MIGTGNGNRVFEFEIQALLALTGLSVCLSVGGGVDKGKSSQKQFALARAHSVKYGRLTTPERIYRANCSLEGIWRWVMTPFWSSR